MRAITPKPSTAKQRMLKLLVCSDAPEQALRYHGFSRIAGVDEVGRGALFGPVVAAAVILPERIAHLAAAGLKDSKQMTREDRETMDRRIRRIALAVSVAEIAADIIDRVNIYQATRLAMLAAVCGLPLDPDHLLIDAMRIDHVCHQTKLIYGDSLSLSIAAASVVAKVHRDNLMRQLDQLHPQYGLASHKGYATPEHRRALKLHGPCPLHRTTFAPVALAGRPLSSSAEHPQPTSSFATPQHLSSSATFATTQPLSSSATFATTQPLSSSATTQPLSSFATTQPLSSFAVGGGPASASAFPSDDGPQESTAWL